MIDLDQFEKTYQARFTMGPFARELASLVQELRAAREVVTAAYYETPSCEHAGCAFWCDACRASDASRNQLSAALASYDEATK